MKSPVLTETPLKPGDAVMPIDLVQITPAVRSRRKGTIQKIDDDQAEVEFEFEPHNLSEGMAEKMTISVPLTKLELYKDYADRELKPDWERRRLVEQRELEQIQHRLAKLTKEGEDHGWIEVVDY